MGLADSRCNLVARRKSARLSALSGRVSHAFNHVQELVPIASHGTTAVDVEPEEVDVVVRVIRTTVTNIRRQHARMVDRFQAHTATLEDTMLTCWDMRTCMRLLLSRSISHASLTLRSGTDAESLWQSGNFTLRMGRSTSETLPTASRARKTVPRLVLSSFMHETRHLVTER